MRRFLKVFALCAALAVAAGCPEPGTKASTDSPYATSPSGTDGDASGR